MRKREAHEEAIYLIKNYTENWKYDIARGCAEMAHGIAIITDDEYDKLTTMIEKEELNFRIY